MKRRAASAIRGDGFELVRKFGLSLPDVEESTMYRYAGLEGARKDVRLYREPQVRGAAHPGLYGWRSIGATS